MKQKYLMDRDQYTGLESLFPDDYFEEEMSDTREYGEKYSEGGLIIFGCLMICVGLICLFRAALM